MAKNIIFKTLALWTFVFLAQFLQIPKEITTTIQLKNIKIKQEILCNDFQSGSLKNVDMSIKISCLQCFWVRKVHHQNYDDWKLIPMHFINNAFKKDFIFIQILVSKLLYCISFLLFTLTFFIHGKETFLISLTLLVV